MKHLVSARQFSSPLQLQKLFDRADYQDSQMESVPRGNGKVLATLFYQPSTRTRLSFETAMYRLGGNVISSSDAVGMSSHAKGESLEDTIRTVSEFADIIALRHFEKGAAARAAQNCLPETRIINAGDGDGEHPTQALLDMYTIYKEFGHIDNLHIAMIGDLFYGRTIHSLIYLLGLYKGVRVTICHPPDLALPCEVQDYLKEDRGEFTLAWHSRPDIEQVMYSKPDVVYMTRAQQTEKTGYRYNQNYCFGARELEMLGSKAIVMHPLPRQHEIDPVVDLDPRMCFWKQVRNGVRIRMALMDEMLTEAAWL